MKEDGSSQATGNPPVVSQFFNKPKASQKQAAEAAASSGSSAKKPDTSKAIGNGIQKQASIISLSDDDADEIEVIEQVPAKRKSATENGKAEQGKAAKKIKVAPLFEKTKALPAVKREDGSSSAVAPGAVAGLQDSLSRLQQWKFSATPAAKTTQSTSTLNSSANGLDSAVSSSPLPDVPRASAPSKADRALEAQRALVRKRLMGHDADWRKHMSEADDSAPPEPNSASDNDEDDAPVASTSKAAKGKSKASEDKENIPPANSRFADFASSTKETASAAKGKGKAGKADVKGKGKAIEPAVKYTPLEQQVLDIKKRNVSFDAMSPTYLG